MLRENHYYIFRRRFVLLSGEKGVYLTNLFRALGMNLVYLFIPLYIFELTGKIQAAFLYYAVYHLFVLIAVFPTGFLMTKIGVDITGFIGSILRACFLFLLALSSQNSSFLLAAVIVWGITIPFSWLPFYYSLVGAKTSDGLFGKETSWIKIIDQLAGSLGPFIGGVLIVSFGFQALYGLAIVLVLLSGLPMFFDEFERKNMHFRPKRILTTLIEKQNQNFIISFLGLGLKNVILTIAWPIFVFLVVKNYEVVGGIQTLALLLSLLMLWWLGKLIDKKGYKILKWGVSLTSLTWIIRSFLITPVAVFFSNVVYGFGALLLWTPFDALVYKSMIKRRKLEFLIVREMSIHGSGFLGCLLVFFLLQKQVSWFAIFLLAVLGLAVTLLATKEEIEYVQKS
jgi:MFS family permease